MEGNWLYPDEVEKRNNNFVKKVDQSKVVVGPLKVCQNPKNTIDPETMINHYGADSVRWFILSDSPPEKDIQWSDTGVSSANKFLQKIWNLNVQISKMDDKKNNADSNNNFASEINSY